MYTQMTILRSMGLPQEIVIGIFRIRQLRRRDVVRPCLSVKAVFEHRTGIVQYEDEVCGDYALGDRAGDESLEAQDILSVSVRLSGFQIFVQSDVFIRERDVLFGVESWLGMGNSGQENDGCQAYQGFIFAFHFFIISLINQLNDTPNASQACRKVRPSSASMACTGISITSSRSV